MPIHDWTRVPAGLFHHFHQDWSIEIARNLNRGLLPKGLSALVEQRAASREPNFLAIERFGNPSNAIESATGTATLARPLTRIVRRASNEIYSDKANRIVVRHRLGRIVAVIEIISPGNKDSRASLRDFVKKTIGFLRGGIHMLVVDLFPPTPRDPFGIHKVIWDEIFEEEFAFPPGKDRILASYETGGIRAAYVEPIAVGDAMPDMPLFIANDLHVPVPLEKAYFESWNDSPESLRSAVVTGVLPDADAD
jgi:hypothetical protein